MGVIGWRVNAQFVLALGDNFYVDGVTNTTDRLWNTAFHDIYSASSLQIPWYPILGNHGRCTYCS
jgi:tartrate-resistant acid phosphatase type 5